jgi:hypothetical protein
MISDYRLDNLARTNEDAFKTFMRGKLKSGVSEFTGCLTSLDTTSVDDEWYFTTKEDGTYVCWQYYNNYDEASWYLFLRMIAKYIEDGAEIECIGEDHSEWIFYKENGKWYEGTYRKTIDKENAYKI